jgi:hypothetical protein
MLQGRNLLRRRKNIKIKKRRKWGILYLLIASFLFSLLLIFVGFYINANYLDLVSPLSKTKFQDSAKLEEALLKANIKFIKISPQNDYSFLVKLVDEEEVIFSSKKDYQSQIASLQLITKRLTIEGKRFRGLDFRYDKPMIIF